MASTNSIPKELGDFEILRELGHHTFVLMFSPI